MEPEARSINSDKQPRSIFDSGIPQKLEDLAVAINEEHRACEGAMRSTLEHARRAGEMLIHAKTDVPHGEWEAWLKDNFEGSTRTAQGYMQVFRRWGELQETQRVADLSLRGALKELSEPSAKAASPPWKHASPPWKHASPESIPIEIKQDDRDEPAPTASTKPVPIEIVDTYYPVGREPTVEPTVRDVLTAQDMADIPSGEFDRFENWASETSKIIGPLRRMSPSEVADACERLYPKKLDRHIDWAKQIAEWYAAYAEELEAKKSQGLRVVE